MDKIRSLLRPIKHHIQRLVRRYIWIKDGVHIARGSYVELGTVIGRRTRINNRSHIGKCNIGSYCAIGGRLIIRSHNHTTQYLNMNSYCQKHIIQSNVSVSQVYKGEVKLGNGVWIGDSVIILPGVHIGNGAVIGAGSVVTKPIPDFAIAAGNPARVIRYRYSTEIIQLLSKIEWWNWSDEQLRSKKELFDTDFTAISLDEARSLINRLAKE